MSITQNPMDSPEKGASNSSNRKDIKSAADATSTKPPRSGRGGRHGRGGRGRGRSHHSSKSKKKHAEEDDRKEQQQVDEGRQGSAPAKDKSPDKSTNASEPTSTGGRGGRGGGRSRGGGRGRGRGRGRQRNGRGGRGRSRNDNGDRKDNEADGNAAVVELETDVHLNHNADTATDVEVTAVQSESRQGSQPGDAITQPGKDVTTGNGFGVPAGGRAVPELSLPSPATASTDTPAGKTKKRGASRKHHGPKILLRSENPPGAPLLDYDAEAKKLSERLAAAALDEDTDGHQAAATQASADSNDGVAKREKPKKPKKKKAKKKAEATTLPSATIPEAEQLKEVSTTEALAQLKGTEVSISSQTTVKIKRDDSSASLNKMEEPRLMKTTGKKKGGSSKKSKGLHKGDHEANRKAARAFNQSVQVCVQRSDADSLRDILHDKRNHHFALDNVVLELVMKAYVMAAMFEDALYCLRNCTLPGTLSTTQTEHILQCMPQNLRNSSSYSAADMINALCIATEFDNPTSRTYFLRIVRGIALEFLEEVVSARDRICSAPCERLVRSSMCVVNARLKRGKKPTELVVEPGDQLGIFVPDTMENRGIQTGDAVSLLPYAGPYPVSAESLDRNMIEATVINTNPMVIRLQDKANAKLHAMLTEPVDGNLYRIDKLANRMGFNRQLSAAVAIASPFADPKAYDSRRPSSQLIRSITAMDENIDRIMNQQNHGNFKKGELTSTAALCAEAVPWSHDDEEVDRNGSDQDALRMAAALALDKYGALQGLNGSQRLAVEGATSNRLTLVQGPPGSGKTAVAIRILQHWARLAASQERQGGKPSPILATSDSNIAVDNLVEGCAAVGLRVVRLGRPEAIRPELLRYCIDRPTSSYANGDGSVVSTPQNYKERNKQLKNAQIVCCTCIGSGGEFLDSMTFERVLIDEATQATEAAVLVPLMRGCRQLVLVGDHCQLPPTVLSTRAEEEGHGVPLFSRMVACGVPPFMLDTQYRMHPAIAMFPSDLFYGGKLLNGVTAPERRPLAGFPWPREEFPVAFVPVYGDEIDDGMSKMNEAEAAAACDAVEHLLKGGQCGVSDIAVVTPYAAQARLIRRLLRRLMSANGPPYIEVSSVDGFQGREKEAVVFSAVRSNNYGAIGFTADWRRVNVSFTRARRALIVIGNDQTLRRGDPETWAPWLAWADAHGINMDKPGVPRGRYDPEQLRKVRGGTTAAEMLKDVLARQQAQLKNAARQLEKANKNAEGHIIGSVDGELGGLDQSADVLAANLEEDLAGLTNADGNWDDDSDDDAEIHRSVSRVTLTSMSSSNNDRDASDDDNGPTTDIWDL